MSDTTMTIFAIFLAATVMFIFPLMATADKSDSISQEIVQSATNNFVDTVRTTGRITKDNYNNYLKQLSATGNAYDVKMEVQILDENANKKTTQAAAEKVGENYYYSEYTSQIESAIANKGVYLLKQGDQIKVEVSNANKTISQQLKSFMYRISGDNSAVIAASSSGIVSVNG